MTFADLIASASGGCKINGCSHSHAGPMYLHARCHPRSGTFAVVDGRKLRIECATCKKIVVEVQA